MADIRDGKPDLPASARVVFVFPPLRSEHKGMGLDLLASHNAFERHMQLCETAFADLLDWSLEDVLRENPDSPPLERLDVSQPALFAMTASLAELWRSLGVRPDAVVGHSVGEIAAAASCGALSLRDAARVASTWGRSSMRLEGTGAMASVSLSAELTEEWIGHWKGRLSIAGLNSPAWTAVAGEEEAVRELLEELAGDGIHGSSMSIPAPGHSSGMAPIHEWFLEELTEISPQPSPIPFYSTVSGDRLDTAGLDADYWSGNLRRPVLFEPAIRALLRDGYDVFIEVGPRPILTTALEEIIGAGGAITLSTFERDDPDTRVPFTLPGASPLRREQAALDLVLAEVASARGYASPIEVDPDRPFKDLGFDSEAAVGLRNALNRLTGLALPVTLAFDYPTPGDVARKLRLELEGGAETKPLAAAPNAIDELDANSLVELALAAEKERPGPS
jgi:acyl transferase domain-containing protein